MAIEKYNDWRNFNNINEGLFRKSGEEKEDKIRRKGERKEDKFLTKDDENLVDTSEFNVKSFRKSVEALKALTNSLIIDAKTREVSGNKAATQYVESFRDYLLRISRLLGEIEYQIKRKGKELDKTEDAELIKGFKNVYIKLKDQINKSAESYKNDSDKSAIEAIEGLEFKDISDLLSGAQDKFEQAKKEVEKLNTLIQTETAANLSAGKDSSPGKESKSDELKISSSIKKADVKGKKNDVIEKVQKTFFEIYESHESLKATPLYKKAKGYGADGIWGPTTSKVIDSLKAMIGKIEEYKGKDLGTSDEINQTFLDGLNSLKSALLKKAESIDPINQVQTFESFISKTYSKVNEEGDLDAIIQAGVSAAGGSGTEEKKSAPVIVKKKEVVKALEDAAPKEDEKKEVKVENTEELMNKAVEYAKDQINLETAKKALAKIKGVTIIKDFDASKNYSYYPHGYSEKNRKEKYAPTMKGQKDGGTPFATCKGMKFYRNGLCVVTYSGELGFYDASTGYYSIYAGKKTYWRESIKDLIANKGVPRKYRYLTKELVSMFSSFTMDSTITKFFKVAYKYNETTVGAIFRAGKYLMKEKGIDILVELRELAEENKEARKFYYKNKEALKKLV